MQGLKRRRSPSASEREEAGTRARTNVAKVFLREYLAEGAHSKAFKCDCILDGKKSEGIFLRKLNEAEVKAKDPEEEAHQRDYSYSKLQIQLISHFHQRGWGPALLCVSGPRDEAYEGFVTQAGGETYEDYCFRVEAPDFRVERAILRAVREIASSYLCLLDLKPANVVVEPEQGTALLIDLDPVFVRTAHAACLDQGLGSQIQSCFRSAMLAILAITTRSKATTPKTWEELLRLVKKLAWAGAEDSPEQVQYESVKRRSYFFATDGKVQETVTDQELYTAIEALARSLGQDLQSIAFETHAHNIESMFQHYSHSLNPRLSRKWLSAWRGSTTVSRQPASCQVQDLSRADSLFVPADGAEPRLCELSFGQSSPEGQDV